MRRVNSYSSTGSTVGLSIGTGMVFLDRVRPVICLTSGCGCGETLRGNSLVLLFITLGGDALDRQFNGGGRFFS